MLDWWRRSRTLVYPFALIQTTWHLKTHPSQCFFDSIIGCVPRIYSIQCKSNKEHLNWIILMEYYFCKIFNIIGNYKNVSFSFQGTNMKIIDSIMIENQSNWFWSAQTEKNGIRVAHFCHITGMLFTTVEIKYRRVKIDRKLLFRGGPCPSYIHIGIFLICCFICISINLCVSYRR